VLPDQKLQSEEFVIEVAIRAKQVDSRSLRMSYLQRARMFAETDCSAKLQIGFCPMKLQIPNYFDVFAAPPLMMVQCSLEMALQRKRWIRREATTTGLDSDLKPRIPNLELEH